MLARKMGLYSLALAFFCLPISVSAFSLAYAFSALVVLFSGQWKQKWQKISQNPLTYWLWALGALLLIGALYSAGKTHFIQHDLYKHLWVFLTPLFFWLFATEQDRRFVLNAFLVSISAVLLLSYLKFFHWIPWQNKLIDVLHLNKVGAQATVFQSHISQSFFLALASGCWFYRFYEEDKNKVWYALLTLAATFNIFFLNSGRTGYIAYILIMLFLFYQLLSVKKFIVSSLLLFVIVLFAFSTSTMLHDRVASIGKNAKVQGTSVGLRVAMLENGWKIFKKRPWFGYGTGGFSAGYAALSSADIAKTKTNPLDSGLLQYTLENTFLNIMIEYGLVGLLFLLSFIVALYVYAGRLSAPYPILMRAFLLIFFAGAMATAFFASSFSKSLFSIMLALGYSDLVMESRSALLSRLKFFLSPD